MSNLTTTVSLSDMRFYAHHGVMPQERLVGNDFLVSVTLRLSVPVESDELPSTVSYADVAQIVAREMEKPSNLIEHCAHRILTAILSAPFAEMIEEMRVKVSKPKPPIPHMELREASTELRWQK